MSMIIRLMWQFFHNLTAPQVELSDLMPLSLQLVSAAVRLGNLTNGWSVIIIWATGIRSGRTCAISSLTGRVGNWAVSCSSIWSRRYRVEMNGAAGSIKINVPIVPMRANRNSRAANGFVNEINLKYLRTGSNKLKKSMKIVGREVCTFKLTRIFRKVNAIEVHTPR